MAKHDDRVSLDQMRSHAREAETFTRGRVRADLDTDRLLSLALLHLLHIIGEAASRVSQPTRDQHPQIPWNQIVALRNRLAHGYDTVNLDIVWAILTTEVPPLIQQLDGILGNP